MYLMLRKWNQCIVHELQLKVLGGSNHFFLCFSGECSGNWPYLPSWPAHSVHPWKTRGSAQEAPSRPLTSSKATSCCLRLPSHFHPCLSNLHQSGTKANRKCSCRVARRWWWLSGSTWRVTGVKHSRWGRLLARRDAWAKPSSTTSATASAIHFTSRGIWPPRKDAMVGNGLRSPTTVLPSSPALFANLTGSPHSLYGFTVPGYSHRTGI